jgi:hypothetical protein
MKRRMRKVGNMRSSSSHLLLAVAVTLALTGIAGPLRAQESCRIRVETILAARQGTFVDPQLEHHIDELQSLFKFTTYRLLGSENLDLTPGRSQTLTLPGDRRLKITLQNIRGNRADIALQMIKKERTVFHTRIQLLNRGSLFIGGPEYRTGNLILKISCAY